MKLWIDSHQTIQLNLLSSTNTELLVVILVISGIGIIILNVVVFQDNNKYMKCTFSHVTESKMRFQCLNVSVPQANLAISMGKLSCSLLWMVPVVKIT